MFCVLCFNHLVTFQAPNYGQAPPNYGYAPYMPQTAGYPSPGPYAQMPQYQQQQQQNVNIKTFFFFFRQKKKILFS